VLLIEIARVRTEVCMREILIATLKTGGGSVGRLLLLAVATKIVAVILGPSGIGLLSLLRQAADLSNSLGTLGGSNALVQGLSSRKGNMRDEYLVTTFWLFVLGSLLIVGTLLICAPWIALWGLNRSDGETISLVRWLALPVALGVATSYLNGVLNSFRAIGLMALVQVLGAAATALLAYPVSRLVEVGYPIAFIVMLSAPPAVGVILGASSALRRGWLAPLFHRLRVTIYSDSLRHFFSVAGTLVITGAIALGTLLAVRSLTVHYAGLTGAGIFGAAWAISTTYIMLVVESFGTYYLPTLSQTSDTSTRIMLMKRTLRLSTLLMVPLVVGVTVLKPLAIELLYSEEFVSSLEILRWLLIGDYIGIVGWVFAMPMLAYADMRVFFWTEFLAYAGFLAFAALALFAFSSIQGIGIGSLLVDTLGLVYYLYYASSRHQFPLTKDVVTPWLLGLALVVGASAYTWSHTQVEWFIAPLWIGAAVSFSWLSLNRNERRDVLRMLLRREGTPS
jgi:O-antigen/teichoic acid export membrane protein